MLIDRGTCQTYADQGIGDATDCWKPVYINLMFTDLIVFWLELLFLAMPGNTITMKAEKIKKRAAFEQQVIITIPSILFVLADPFIEQWMETSSLPYIVVYICGNVAEFSAFLWWFVVHFSDLRPFTVPTWSWTWEWGKDSQLESETQLQFFIPGTALQCKRF